MATCYKTCRLMQWGSAHPTTVLLVLILTAVWCTAKNAAKELEAPAESIDYEGGDKRDTVCDWEGCSQVPPGRFNYYASICDEKYVHMCGGVLVGRYWVLATAYCTELSRPNLLVVINGPEQQVHTVVGVLVHPSWNGNIIYGWNAALLQLAVPVDVPVPQLRSSQPYPNEHIHILQQNFTFPCKIRAAGMAVLPSDVCGLKNVMQHELWACPLRAGTQPGDLGGPALGLDVPPDFAIETGFPEFDLVSGILSYVKPSASAVSGVMIMQAVSPIRDWIYCAMGTNDDARYVHRQLQQVKLQDNTTFVAHIGQVGVKEKHVQETSLWEASPLTFITAVVSGIAGVLGACFFIYCRQKYGQHTNRQTNPGIALQEAAARGDDNEPVGNDSSSEAPTALPSGAGNGSVEAHQGTMQREGRRREAIESASESARGGGEEQDLAGGSNSREQESAGPLDKEDRHKNTGLDEMQQQLMGFRYNPNMMQFLKEQMDKAQGVAQAEGWSSPQFDIALEQGNRLIGKHSEPFNVKRFYKIEDAAGAVLNVCQTFRDSLGYHRHQIAFQIPQECIDKDKQHLYAHLGYVLKGSQCDFGDEEGFQKEWEALRSWHEDQMRGLNVIADTDLVVGERTGGGGYSQVYKGKWSRVDVAVKKVNAADGASELSVEDFTDVFKEASMLASLNHPHIVRLYGLTKSGWMVMELADGDLSSLWAGATLAWNMTLTILEQAASALKYVHCRTDPMVHGDIKDSNFLYTKTGKKHNIKLADFGLTTEVRNWQTNTVRKARATPRWQAPELHTGQNPSLESDVFSFGLVMHAAVTGAVPYGFGTSDLGVMSKKLEGEPPCSVGDKDCPGAFRDLMGRCVARKPGDRPTMSEVAECLSRLPRDWQAGR